jgi:hypothetical protein
VIEQESTRFRKHTLYGYAEDLDQLEASSPRPEALEALDRPAGAAAPRTRRMPRWPTHLIAAGVGALATWLALGLTADAPRSPQAQERRAPFESAPRSPPPAAAAASEADAVLSADPPASEPGQSKAVQSVEPVPPPASLAPEQPQAQVAPGPPVLGVELDGRRTRLLVPLAGSLEGATGRRWSKPLAVVLDLPEARSLLANGTHNVERGSVRYLRVMEAQGGTALRIVLARPVADYELAQVPGSLEITLTHTPDPDTSIQ